MLLRSDSPDWVFPRLRSNPNGEIIVFKMDGNRLGSESAKMNADRGRMSVLELSKQNELLISRLTERWWAWPSRLSLRIFAHRTRQWTLNLNEQLAIMRQIYSFLFHSSLTFHCFVIHNLEVIQIYNFGYIAAFSLKLFLFIYCKRK